jgi:hypothetical protein
MRSQWKWASVFIAVAAGLVALWLLPERPSAVAPTSGPSNAPAVLDERLDLRSYTALVLLHEVPVQVDLEMTAAQTATVEQLVAEFLEELKPGLERARGLKKLSADEQTALLTELDQRRRKLTTEFSGRATGLLSPKQQLRLEQIALQFRQEEAFYEPDIVRQLGLTSDQLQRITASRLSLRKSAESFAQQHARKDLSRKDMDESIRRLREDTLMKHESLLNARQRAIYEELRGPRIAFTKEDLRWELRASPLIKHLDAELDK